jgi:hypothetical protein
MMDPNLLPPLPQMKTERDQVFQARLFEEPSARDLLNRDTASRTEEFIAAVRSDVCYDPAFIEFFSNSQQRIEELTAKLEGVRSGRITQADIDETKARVNSVISLLAEQPDSIQKQISALEQKTHQLMTKQIPAAIATLER